MVKFSTKEVGRKRAWEMAMSTRGRGKRYEDKRRKAQLKRWRIKGY